MIAAPPPWVLGLSIDSGAWRCLVGLWSFADYGTAGATHVWPTREQLAERTGQSLTAIKKQLAKLAAEGLVTAAEGRGWVLAWSPQGPARPLQGPPRSPQGPAPTGTPEAPVGTAPAPTGTAEAPAGTPVNQAYLAGPSRDLAGDARAHLALVEETRRAVAEAGRPVTREHIAAVRAAGPHWARELQRSTWETALGETIVELELTPAQVGQVLAAWDAAREAAGGSVVGEGRHPRQAARPTRLALWWGCWRPWVRQQLGLGGVGIGCAWPEGSADSARLGGRAAW